MGNVDATGFAAEWIAAWNSHNLDRIVLHYADDIVFRSLAQQRMKNGRITGLSALRAYWGSGLQAQPNLKFELIEVFRGHECLTIHYRNHRGQTVAETVEFGPEGKVVRSFACYA